jgi:hypothetical protein
LVSEFDLEDEIMVEAELEVDINAIDFTALPADEV